MPIGPIYQFAVEPERLRTVSPNYQDIVQELRLRTVSPNYQDVVQELRVRATSHNYGLEVPAFTLGLLRNAAIQEETLTSAHFENQPIEVLGSTTATDLETSQTITLYQVSGGETVAVVGILVEATNANTVSVVPQISVSADATVVLDTESLVNFTTTGDVWANWLSTGKTVAATAGQDITATITGGTATTLLGAIYLMGIKL